MVGIYVSREQDLIIRDYFRREPEVKLALDFPQVFFSELGFAMYPRLASKESQTQQFSCLYVPSYGITVVSYSENL